MVLYFNFNNRVKSLLMFIVVNVVIDFLYKRVFEMYVKVLDSL